MTQALTTAIRLLRDAAQELAEGISVNGVPDWQGEPETAAAYDETMAAVVALEAHQAENATLQAGYDAARLEIDALRSRQCLHGISEPSGWMPIETAPKDGTLIVLGARNGVWLGKYLPLYRSGYRPENPWSSMLLNHDHMAERYTRPTHWMPLPPSPSSADEGGRNG